MLDDRPHPSLNSHLIYLLWGLYRHRALAPRGLHRPGGEDAEQSLRGNLQLHIDVIWPRVCKLSGEVSKIVRPPTGRQRRTGPVMSPKREWVYYGPHAKNGGAARFADAMPEPHPSM
jgi:hypothetical protein